MTPRLPESYFDETINRNRLLGQSQLNNCLSSSSEHLIKQYGIINQQRYQEEKESLVTGDDVEPYIASIVEYEQQGV